MKQSQTCLEGTLQADRMATGYSRGRIGCKQRPCNCEHGDRVRNCPHYPSLDDGVYLAECGTIGRIIADGYRCS
jgi:hypothetical protein